MSTPTCMLYQKMVRRNSTKELVDMLKKHPKVTGLYWWFPEENESGKKVIGSWINRGLFNNHTGKVVKAMKNFADYRSNND